MNFAEIVGEVRQLSEEERLSLVQIILTSLKKRMTEETEDIIPLLSLRGVLKTDQPAPSNEEIKEDYYKYLEAKYR